jgi:hypothetical protein
MAIRYGKGYRPETKNQSAIKSIIKGILRFRKPERVFFNASHFKHLFLSTIIQEEHTDFVQKTHVR